MRVGKFSIFLALLLFLIRTDGRLMALLLVTIGGALAFLVFGVIYLFECIVE